MSFTVFYNAQQDLSRGFESLTGIVGENGLLYWLCKDVHKIVGRWNSHASFQNQWIRVEDITGRSATPFGKTLARSKIIPHDFVVKLMRESSRPTVRDFGQRIDHRDTRVQVFRECDGIDVNTPAQVLLLGPERGESNIPYFFIWYHMFRLKVMQFIYNLYPECKESAPFLTYLEPLPFQHSIVPPGFPQIIKFYIREKYIVYSPEVAPKVNPEPKMEVPDSTNQNI